MTREEAIYRLKNTAWLGTDEEREQTEQAVDMAIEALNNSIQMSNIQQLDAENGALKEMIKFYRNELDGAESVVRCKDCRHYLIDYFNATTGWCYEIKNSVNEDDFCSYGERREP